MKRNIGTQNHRGKLQEWNPDKGIVWIVLYAFDHTSVPVEQHLHLTFHSGLREAERSKWNDMPFVTATSSSAVKWVHLGRCVSSPSKGLRKQREDPSFCPQHVLVLRCGNLLTFVNTPFNTDHYHETRTHMYTTDFLTYMPHLFMIN